MTITRLLGLALLVVLLARLLPAIVPSIWPGWRAQARRLQVTIDVAGGLIIGAIVVLVLVRGDTLGGLLLLLIGLPVFWGTLRALPAWWRGHD